MRGVFSKGNYQLVFRNVSPKRKSERQSAYCGWMQRLNWQRQIKTSYGKIIRETYLMKICCLCMFWLCLWIDSPGTCGTGKHADDWTPAWMWTWNTCNYWWTLGRTRQNKVNRAGNFLGMSMHLFFLINVFFIRYIKCYIFNSFEIWNDCL